MSSKIKGKPLFAEVIENKKLSEEIYQITLLSDHVSQNAEAGQFVSLLCDDLILRRPFSIANVDGETFQIIYKVKGKGTEFIAGLKQGEAVNIIGPLGKGFSIQNKKSLLIGAGVGIAPVLFLSNVLKKRNLPFKLIAGFQKSLPIDEMSKNNSHIITEDGSSELKGRINDHLDRIIEEYKPEILYSCGPEIVLKYVVEAAKKYNIESEVALEREFACGSGVCMGCSIKVLENGKEVNRRICKDGPVFDGGSMLWQN
jgi:dihydroorotate dehydrogenase electron transfer subunit